MKAAAHVCPQGQAKGEGTAEAACVLGAGQGAPGQLRSCSLREANAQHPAHGLLSMSPRSLRPDTDVMRTDGAQGGSRASPSSWLHFICQSSWQMVPTSHRQDRVEPQSLSLRTDGEAVRLPCRAGHHLRAPPKAWQPRREPLSPQGLATPCPHSRGLCHPLSRLRCRMPLHTAH